MESDHLSGEPSAEFRPELISRRGEFISWVTTLMGLVTWAALIVIGESAPVGLIILTVFLLLAALSISLGNWMDRQTRIRLEVDGIGFQNGLRRAHLRWDEIQQVQVYPSNWGDKVRVLGPQARFDFRTLGEVTVRGDVKGRMGFVEGEKILEHILDKTHLREVQRSGSGYYYARE